MKKFNARLPVIVALSMCAGIFVALILFLYGLSLAWLALSFAPAIAVLAIWAAVSKKFLKPLIFIILSLAFFFIGAVDCYFTAGKFDATELEPDAVYYIKGKVVDKGFTESGEYAVIDGVTCNGIKINGKMNLYLAPYYKQTPEVGYTVSLYGSPQKVPTFNYGKLNYRAEDNIKYILYVYGGMKLNYGFSLLGTVRSAIRNTLFNNLSEETAAVSYAMLTGNTMYVERQSLEQFRYGGIAHIFAVSGLHVGIIYSIFALLFKKLKFNKYVSASLLIAIIFFYVAVCGFTLSSVRAAVMCAAASLARLIYVKNDGLNSLSAAVIVILAISPLSLFSVGFQLSVCATGGILVLSKLYCKALNKIKIPKKISSYAGASLGAQTATAPILLANFGYISGSGLLLNIVFLPILSAIFGLIFVSVLLCLIIPPLSPLVLPYSALPLELFISVLTGLGFEKTLISGFGAGWFVPIYFAGALFLSDKVNLKSITRLVAIGCSSIILISYTFAKYAYPYVGYSVIVSAYGDGGEVIIKSGYGTLLIITDDVNVSRLDETLNEHYINEIDAIIILGEDAAGAYADLNTDCREIRLNDRFPQIQPYGDFLLIYENSFNVCGVDCKFCDNCTLYAEFGGVSMGVCSKNNFALPDCDILITDTENSFICCKTEIYFNKPFGSYNVLDRGDVTLRINNGNYGIKTALPPRN